MAGLRLFLIGFVALVGVSIAAHAQEVTLKLHYALPIEATVSTNALVPWAEKIATDSGGRLKIELQPSMQLGGEPTELWDQLLGGAVDMVWTVADGQRFAPVGVFELPFMGTAAEPTSKAVQEFCRRHCEQVFAGAHVIAWHTEGRGLLHSKNAITRLEDMNGLKTGGAAPTLEKLLAVLGARIVPTPAPAVPESLSRGLVDATAMDWSTALLLRIHVAVKNHTGFAGEHGLSTRVHVLAINSAVYERLPDDLKRVLDANSGMATATLFGQAMDVGDEAGRAAAKKLENSINILDETETQRWKDAAAPIIDAWVAEAATRELDGQALLDDARTLVEKYSAPPPPPPPAPPAEE